MDLFGIETICVIINKLDQMIQGVSEKSFFSSGRISFTVFYPFIYLWEKIIEEDFNQNILNLSSSSYDTSKQTPILCSLPLETTEGQLHMTHLNGRVSL